MKNSKSFTMIIMPAVLFSAVLLATTSCNHTQVTTNNTGADTVSTFGGKVTTASISKNDSAFLIKVAQINMEEIKLGALAQQNTMMADVKELGKMMQADHSKAQNELMTLSQKKSIMLPTMLDANAQADCDKLSKLSGSDFDKKYCSMMVDGHKGAIALFEKESTDANDSDIKHWAVATLPTLQKHLDHATLDQQNCNKL